MMYSQNQLMFHTGSSVLGNFAIIWSLFDESPGIVRILLTQSGISREKQITGRYGAILPRSCPGIDAIAGRIESFLNGRITEFSLAHIRLELCPPFQKRVLEAEYRIPRGCVSTYQRIARYVQHPGAARAVGNALARNPFPVIIPCHRAIRSDGTTGGFQGGPDMKRALLEYEGNRFDSRNRMILPHFHY